MNNVLCFNDDIQGTAVVRARGRVRRDGEHRVEAERDRRPDLRDLRRGVRRDGHRQLPALRDGAPRLVTPEDKPTSPVLRRRSSTGLDHERARAWTASAPGRGGSAALRASSRAAGDENSSALPEGAAVGGRRRGARSPPCSWARPPRRGICSRTTILRTLMGECHERPIIMPLSNPTSPRGVHRRRRRRRRRAGARSSPSGSPFDEPVVVDGRYDAREPGEQLLRLPRARAGDASWSASDHISATACSTPPRRRSRRSLDPRRSSTAGEIYPSNQTHPGHLRQGGQRR